MVNRVQISSSSKRKAVDTSPPRESTAEHSRETKPAKRQKKKVDQGQTPAKVQKSGGAAKQRKKGSSVNALSNTGAAKVMAAASSATPHVRPASEPDHSSHIISQKVAKTVTDKESKALLRNVSIPGTPPASAFRVPIPPKVTPWEESWAAPTETFEEETACPVDWIYVRAHTDGLNDAHIQAYELRAPWNPENRQLPFGAVVKAINQRGDHTVNCEEGVRKRFATANLKVYETTGVYFENNVKGLEKDYNLCARKNKTKASAAAVEDYDYLIDKENKQEAAPTYRFILQPPAPNLSDRCPRCCDEGFCYDEGCREDDCCSEGCCDNPELCEECDGYGYRLDDCTEISCGTVKCKCPCEHRSNYKIPAHSVEAYQAMLKRKRAPFGCPEHEAIVVRDIVQDMLNKVSLRQFNQTTLLRIDTRAFDIFTSCIVLGVHNGVPRRLLRLSQRDPKAPWEDLTYEPVDEEVTLGDLCRAYCCSQVLDCPSVSDMIINHIVIVLKQQEEYENRRRTGIPGSKNPVPYIRNFDIESEEINYVFRNTTATDPLRQLLLDIFTIWKSDFEKKMRNNEAQCHPQFLKYWLQRDLQGVHSNQSHLLQQLEELVEKREEALANGEEAHELLDQIDNVQFDLAAQDANHKSLQQRLENFNVRGESESSADGLVGKLLIIPFDPNADAESTIWGDCRFEGWVPNDPPSSKLVALSEEDLQERLSSIPSTLFMDAVQFCQKYHNECARDSPCLHKLTLAGRTTKAAKRATRRAAAEEEEEDLEESPIAPIQGHGFLNARLKGKDREVTPLTLAAGDMHASDAELLRREQERLKLLDQFAAERTRRILRSYV